MRLHGRLKNIIKNSIIKAFGGVEVVIFGSRTDNSKSGGDIDLAIKTDMPTSEFKRQKIIFITDLIRQEIDLKINLIQLKEPMDKILQQEIQREGQPFY